MPDQIEHLSFTSTIWIPIFLRMNLFLMIISFASDSWAFEARWKNHSLETNIRSFDRRKRLKSRSHMNWTTSVVQRTRPSWQFWLKNGKGLSLSSSFSFRRFLRSILHFPYNSYSYQANELLILELCKWLWTSWYLCSISEQLYINCYIFLAFKGNTTKNLYG